MLEEHREALARIDADRKQWMKTELMVDCQMSSEKAAALVEEWFHDNPPRPHAYRLEAALKKIATWQFSNVEDIADFAQAELSVTPAPQSKIGSTLDEFLERPGDNIVGGEEQTCSQHDHDQQKHPDVDRFSIELQEPVTRRALLHSSGCTTSLSGGHAPPPQPREVARK